MNKQDKELLLFKDLSARLPYGVKFSCKDIKGIWTLSGISESRSGYICFPGFPRLYNVVPFLRQMSDMTEEEAEELDEMNICNKTIAFYNRFKEEPHFFAEYNVIGIIDTMQYIDWLIAHYFDFRNLIPMGLALPAPDGMYDFK